MSDGINIINPLRPTGEGWVGGNDVRSPLRSPYPAGQWLHKESGLFVISEVEVVSDKDGIDRGPEYQICISKLLNDDRTGCSADEVKWVLAQFKLDGAEEDTRLSTGRLRRFWRTVDEP